MQKFLYVKEKYEEMKRRRLFSNLIRYVSEHHLV